MSVTNKQRRRDEAIKLLTAVGRVTVPDAMDSGLGRTLGLDSSGVRHLFNGMVEDGLVSSRTKLVSVASGMSGTRKCKVIEFALKGGAA